VKELNKKNKGLSQDWILRRVLRALSQGSRCLGGIRMPENYKKKCKTF